MCRYKGWLAGYQLALDTAKTAKSLLSQSNFAIGYSKDDLTLHTAVYASRFIVSIVCILKPISKIFGLSKLI
jgi:hypothetical protein